jgi:hypothetical protein
MSINTPYYFEKGGKGQDEASRDGSQFIHEKSSLRRDKRDDFTTSSPVKKPFLRVFPELYRSCHCRVRNPFKDDSRRSGAVEAKSVSDVETAMFMSHAIYLLIVQTEVQRLLVDLSSITPNLVRTVFCQLQDSCNGCSTTYNAQLWFSSFSSSFRSIPSAVMTAIEYLSKLLASL